MTEGIAPYGGPDDAVDAFRRLRGARQRGGAEGGRQEVKSWPDDILFDVLYPVSGTDLAELFRRGQAELPAEARDILEAEAVIREVKKGPPPPGYEDLPAKRVTPTSALAEIRYRLWITGNPKIVVQVESRLWGDGTIRALLDILRRLDLKGLAKALTHYHHAGASAPTFEEAAQVTTALETVLRRREDERGSQEGA